MQKATIYAPILGLTLALVEFSNVSDYVNPAFLFILVHGIVLTAVNWWRRLDNLEKTNRSPKGVLVGEGEGEGEEGEDVEEEVLAEQHAILDAAIESHKEKAEHEV